MDWAVDSNSSVSPSQQLVAAALDAVGLGELAPGDRLPSVRVMAGLALVNPNTVTKSYRELERMGITQGRNGSGVYVAESGPELARGLRRAETAATLVEAVRFALRAGYEPAELEALVAAALMEVEASTTGLAGDAEKEGR